MNDCAKRPPAHALEKFPGNAPIMNSHNRRVPFRRHGRCCWGVALLTLGSLAWANEGDEEIRRLLAASPEELMTMSVTIAAQTPQSLAQASGVVSVITADDIRATGTTNLMEILQGVPGIYVKTNLFGAKPLITMRGASGVNVLLMINGAPVKDLVWSPGIFWKGMPAHLIERIEIVRGPGTALFGSDAAAGVINVITKTAGKLQESEAGLRTGGFSSHSGWIHYGTEWNGYQVGFVADVSATDGHAPSIRQDRLGHSDNARFGYDSQDLHLSVAKGHWRLLADYTRHTDVEIGLTGAAVLDPLTRARDQAASLALLYDDDRHAQDWGLHAELRYRDIEYSSGNGFWELPPGVLPPVGPIQYGFNQLDSAERRLNFEVSGTYRGWRGHVLQIGGGHVWQDLYFVRQLRDGMPGDFAPEKMRRNGYVFVQDIWSFARNWELTAGARYDHYSDFGGTLNPRLALVWQTDPRLTTKLMYGQAFRAPSFLELYSQTAANASNPDLQPEKSRTMELSFSWLVSRDLRLGANLYHFVRTDVIAPEATAPYRFQNFERYATNGLEFEANWQPHSNLRLQAHFNAMRNGTVDDPFRDLAIPLKQGYLRMDWVFLPKWNWNLQLSWFDRRPLPAGDPRAVLDAHTLVDTALRYFHGSEWEFAAAVRNLFDRPLHDYSSKSLPDNLPLPGRQLYAEIRYKF